MKKAILVSLVAVMMLFAFTACEQPVPGLSKAIVSADIVQDGVFFVGQPFDASKFHVDVTYSDGTPGTLEGVNVVYEGNTASVSNGGKLSVTLPVAAPGYNDGTVMTKTFKGSIVAYTFDSLTVTGPTAAVETSMTTGTAKLDDDIAASDFTVVGNYRDSDGVAQTVTLVAGADYTVAATLDQDISADDPEGTATATITLTFGSTPETGKTCKFPVTYVPATTVDYGDFGWYNEVIVARQVPASSSVKYFQGGLFDGDSMIELYRVYTENDTAITTTLPSEYYLVKIDNADVEYTLSDGSSLKKDGTAVVPARFAETNSATVTFVYEYIKDADSAYGLKTSVKKIAGMISGDFTTDSEGRIVGVENYTGGASATTDITLSDIKEDYIVGLEAEAIGTNPYLVGWVAKDDYFTVTATYASGREAVLTATTDYTVDTTPVVAGQTSIDIELAGDELATAQKYTDSVTETTAAIRVQAEDYPSTVTATWVSQPNAAGPIDSDNINIEVDWASGHEYTGADGDVEPTLTWSFSPTEIVSGENNIVISWSCNGVSGETALPTVTIV